MKEDIKILEEFLSKFADYMVVTKLSTKSLNKLEQALKKLLKAYKEDEAVIEEMASTLKWLFNDALNHIPSTICTCKGDIRNCKGKICVDCIKDFFRNKVKGEKE